MEPGALLRLGPRPDLGEVGRIKDTRSAAREFEALLIGQLLNSAFSSEQMGLGGEMDSGGQTMLDLGREHLARVIAQGGGLGLGRLLEASLKKEDDAPAATAESSPASH